MKLVRALMTSGGIAAFFFFSWIIQMLWNSIVVNHLGLFKALTYWQAAGLWFLIILLTAWTGIGVSSQFLRRWRSYD
jgi:amino acid transporter